MGDQKAVRMVLKVDLQCEKCYRKVKRVLYKFPQIQDQVFDEKQNAVMITVVCCSPENIKQQICYKGGDSIKSIEIVPPPKPKVPDEKKDKPIEPPPARAKVEPPKQDKPTVTFVDTLPKPAPYFPPPAYPNSVGMCHREWYEGRGGGPSDQLGYYGPTRCYCGYHGRPVYDSWGGGGGGDGYIVNKCDYFSEENPNAACRIM